MLSVYLSISRCDDIENDVIFYFIFQFFMIGMYKSSWFLFTDLIYLYLRSFYFFFDLLILFHKIFRRICLHLQTHGYFKLYIFLCSSFVWVFSLLRMDKWLFFIIIPNILEKNVWSLTVAHTTMVFFCFTFQLFTTNIDGLIRRYW